MKPLTKVTGRPKVIAFDNDGVWLGTNVFAQEVNLNRVTVADRTRMAGVAGKLDKNGTPLYRLRDLINSVVLSDGY